MLIKTKFLLVIFVLPFIAYCQESNNNSWPKLYIPYNGELEFKIYQYDSQKEILKPFKNMNITMYHDTDGERALTAIAKEDIAHIMVNENYFWKFDKGLMVISRPNQPEFCVENKLGQGIKIRQLLKLLMSPDSGHTQYLGVQQVYWEKEKKNDHYGFLVKYNWFGQKVELNVYFNKQTEILEWIEQISPLLLIIQVEDGIKERQFTDEDFKNILQECPKEKQFFKYK